MTTAILAAIALSACGEGGSAPHDEVVAAVAGAHEGEVTRAEAEHWRSITLKTDQAKNPAAPDPPRFARCISATRERLAAVAPPKGTTLPKLKLSQLRGLCQQALDNLRRQALAFVIEAIWIRQEAADRGLEVTPRELAAQMRREQERLQVAAFGGIDRYLKTVGMTKADLEYQVRVHALADELGEQLTAKLPAPTAAEIAEYQTEHAAQLVVPARRDLFAVIAAGRPKALNALRRLRGGQGFARVARALSIDPRSRAAGGRIVGYLPGQARDAAVEQAIQQAAVGTLVGPVVDQRGAAWVFKVTRVTSPRPLPPARARSTARRLLVSERRKKVLDPFMSGLQARWKQRTSCEPGFVIPDCRGAREPAASQ